MQGIGPKIKERRLRLGWSTTKLATLAGISQSFLWRLEQGKATGSWETYEKIAAALGVGLNTFFPNSGSVADAHLGWRKIPVLDFNQAARWASKDGAPQQDENRETIMTHLEHSPRVFAVRLEDNSMEPEFRAGDLVVIDPEIEPMPGDCVFATVKSGPNTFKQYRSVGVNERGDQVFELHALNPLHASLRSDRQELTVAGVMVEHRRFRRR